MLRNSFLPGLLLLTTLLPATPARAFDTVTHDEITRKVTESLGYDAESGRLLNLGNWYADRWDPRDHDGEGQFPPAHCDEERFVEASARIRKLIQQAACQLLSCRRADALESLGRSMHPVQDFFAHSNLVEIEAHDQRHYPIDFLHLPEVHKEAVCDPRTHLTQLPGLAGLTSDYFRAWDLFWKPPGKCSHRELNKDHAQPDASDTADPVYAASLYPAAKARAIEEGIRYLGSGAEPKMYSAIRKAFVPDVAAPPSEACVIDGYGRVIRRETADDARRIQFLLYLHKGGPCPYEGIRLLCPSVDW